MSPRPTSNAAQLLIVGMLSLFVAQGVQGRGQTPTQQNPQGVTLQANSRAFYLRSPYRSLSQNQRLLNSLGLKIILTFDYRKGEPDQTAWKTPGIPGVEGARYFLKPSAGGAYNTLELAATVHPQGGYELVVYGLQVDRNGENPNPELPQIGQLVSELVQAIGEEPPSLDLRQLHYEVYHLSYVHADRALGLLKVLGYTTVEYSGEDAESVYDKIYTPIQKGTGRLPVVVKLIDSTKTSLMDPEPPPPISELQAQIQIPQDPYATPPMTAVPDIGGTFLHQMTSGEPQQRLLLLYDKEEPEPLEALLNLLREKVDVPARQIVIEALVIELLSDRARDLGISFQSTQRRFETSFGREDAETGKRSPFFFTFDKDLDNIFTFRAQVEALLETGEAELLSNPSVLVLDGRQARIQIGQQVPVVKSISTQAGIISSVDYFPVGIVLNLRPRITEDGTEITMQAETIVSAVNQLASSQVSSAAQVFLAPVVDNRQVQSFVRVTDNTPFIIGGLISREDQERITGIPLLSQIPGLGFLFRRTVTTQTKQEVIIVITPHVVPLEEKYFSYVLPKDSSLFDRFGYRLFRNAYRVRGDDLFDLKFVFESNVFQDLLKRVNSVSETEPSLKTTVPFASLLEGGVPGEEILVRRMLWEIVDKTGYARHIDPERIIFFEDQPDAPDGSGFRLAFLNQKLASLSEGQNAMALTFEAQPRGTLARPLVQPRAVVNYENVTAEDYPAQLISGNRRNPDGSLRNWTILVGNTYSGIRVPPFELLRGVLALKRILELNGSMPLTIQDFHLGRQIIFPTEEELNQRYHIIDRDVARLFYEVFHYYPVFEQEFNRQTQHMMAVLDRLE